MSDKAIFELLDCHPMRVGYWEREIAQQDDENNYHEKGE